MMTYKERDDKKEKVQSWEALIYAEHGPETLPGEWDYGSAIDQVTGYGPTKEAARADLERRIKEMADFVMRSLSLIPPTP